MVDMLELLKVIETKLAAIVILLVGLIVGLVVRKVLKKQVETRATAQQVQPSNNKQTTRT